MVERIYQDSGLIELFGEALSTNGHLGIKEVEGLCRDVRRDLDSSTKNLIE